ncbi:hypothetical protein Btru_058748 [Bulinus truncatus]|nr:hypothetical protein Btru_058748 [Bulinus truncatus]
MAHSQLLEFYPTCQPVSFQMGKGGTDGGHLKNICSTVFVSGSGNTTFYNKVTKPLVSTTGHSWVDLIMTSRRRLTLALQILLTVETYRSVNCSTCLYSSWLKTYGAELLSMCNKTNYYITALKRGDSKTAYEDGLSHLEHFRCCDAPEPWSGEPEIDVYADWTSLEKTNKWANCPSGFFLQGLYRAEGTFFSPESYLHDIKFARCSRPVLHPFSYGECYIHDISQCFNSKGECGCKNGFYINAVYKGNGDRLRDLDKLSCCSMATKPRDITNPEDTKTRIMDATLLFMSKLASMLGYAWCEGAKGIYIGEDFERIGDSWQASIKTFSSKNKCQRGSVCDNRLKLMFDDWALVEKEIKYGKSVIDDLQPDTVDSGTTYNKENTTTTESFTLSRTVEETVSHTMNSSWARTHKLGVSLKFKIPFIASGSFEYDFNDNESLSSSNTSVTKSSRTLTKQTTKTLQPHSAAKYSVILSKTRTTVPYTAIITAHFSTKFVGFLRYSGGFGDPWTNYHYKYKGSEKKPFFNYTFGSPSVPFFAALKTESESESQPWLWNEMIKNYDQGRWVLDRLTNETQYQFTLNGILERVAGIKIDVIWETVKMTRREVHSGNSIGGVISNKTITAVKGPNDRPAKVEYPCVSINN